MELFYSKNEGRRRAEEEREEAGHSQCQCGEAHSKCGAQTPHHIAKTDPWRGGASLSQTPEDDAAEGAKIGRQFRRAVQTLAPLQIAALREAAAAFKATTGLGVDGFHPKVPLDLSDECCERVFKLLHKVEMR